jgi:hypothetical protein
LKGPLVEPLHRIPYTAAQSLSNIRLVALEGGMSSEALIYGLT